MQLIIANYPKIPQLTFSIKITFKQKSYIGF